MHNATKSRRVYVRTPVEDRFWKKVIVPPQASSCWEWSGAHLQSGYAVLFDAERRNNVKAHRVA